MSRDATGREVPTEVCAGIGGNKIEYVFAGQLAQRCLEK